MAHSQYVLGSLELSMYKVYKSRYHIQALQCYNKAMSKMMVTTLLVNVNNTPHYVLVLEATVWMNSVAWATLYVKKGSYKLTNKLTTKPEVDVSNTPTVAEMPGILVNAGISVISVGIDQGNLCLI